MLRTFTDTTHVLDRRWEPPLVDEDWHAVCHAIHKGVEGAEWEKLCCESLGRTTAVILRHPSASRRVKTLWKVRDAEEKGRAADREP